MGKKQKFLQKKTTNNLLILVDDNGPGISESEYQNVLKSDEDCFNGHLTDISYIYTTLKQKRLYGISQNIGCFK